jgi:prepilin-type N-terminal cleavage/methylation domain-containing protein
VGRRAFTLAELLVTLAILGVLGGLLLPAVLGGYRYAVRVACAANLRQLGVCTLTYAEDWDRRLPAEANCGIKDPRRSPAWFDRLPDYAELENVGRRASAFQCAGYRGCHEGVFANATPKSFKMNSYLDNGTRPRHYRLGTARRDEGGTALFLDAVAAETGMGQWGQCYASGVDDGRHRGAVNILCLDGRTLAVERRPADGRWAEAITWLPQGWNGGP